MKICANKIKKITAGVALDNEKVTNVFTSVVEGELFVTLTSVLERNILEDTRSVMGK